MLNVLVNNGIDLSLFGIGERTAVLLLAISVLNGNVIKRFQAINATLIRFSRHGVVGLY